MTTLTDSLLPTYEPSYAVALRREIAATERRLTCLVLSDRARRIEEAYLIDLHKFLSEEEAKREVA